MTTFEPGARLVFTHGRTLRPRATALRARRPAASITEGLEVFVQLVIAAMTTEPWRSSPRSPPISSGTVLARAAVSGTNSRSASPQAVFTLPSGTRSCGRRGPARLGSTEPRSSSIVSLNSGSGTSATRKSPCARV